MKLQSDTSQGLNLVTSYSATHIAINHQCYDKNIIVMPSQIVSDWAEGGLVLLSVQSTQQICALKPELILIGTGSRQQFPPVSLLRPLVEAGVGFEIMDTGSACRTYNILAMEGRLVAAALMLS